MPARRRDCETSQASAERTVLLSLADFGWTVAFTGCPEVAEHLESILYGWRLRRPSSPTWTPDAHVRRTKAGFVWRSAVMAKPELWDAHPPASAMQAVCDVHDVLFDWFLAANPRHLCLHAAAVRIGESLICFPSVQRAGKSTLCVALAARGHTMYCDDVLPVERDEKGKAKRLTSEEKHKLKGDDPKLPGYTAELSGLHGGQVVEVHLGRLKGTPPKKPAAGEKEKSVAKDKPSAKEKGKDAEKSIDRDLLVTMIVILSEGPPGRSNGK